MADMPKRLAGPESIGTSEETLYTVPAATTAILRHIRIANTTALAATVNLSIGADAPGTRLLSEFSIAGNGAYDWSGFLVLDALETLRTLSGTSNALTITVSGVETT